jgi:hypothetical protein
LLRVTGSNRFGVTCHIAAIEKQLGIAENGEWTSPGAADFKSPSWGPFGFITAIIIPAIVERSQWFN